MNSQSSQPLIWTFVALLTAALFASALKWGRITIDLPEPPIQESQFIDLSFIKIQKPESNSTPRPAPPIIPPQESPAPEPEPVPQLGALAEPEPKPKPPRPDPALAEKQRQVKAAQEREIARKRIEEKRRQRLAAQKAAAARAAARKQVVSKPSGINQPKPKYPSAARRAGQQGTVTLSFTVGTSGNVTSVRIAKSSGHPLLDNAALAAIRRWRFRPARNALGEAISYSYTLPMPFRLR